MKVIIALFGIATFASAIEQVDFKIPEVALKKLHNFAMPCVGKFNVDASLISKLGDPTFPRDDASSKFLHCYAENSNFIDNDGHMNVDRITDILEDHPLKEDTKKALAKCNEVTLDNPLATTIAMHKCYIQNSPIIYKF